MDRPPARCGGAVTTPGYFDRPRTSTRYRAMCRIASFGLRELLVEQRQVVVAVGEVGIAAQRRLVRASTASGARPMSSSSTPRLKSSTGIVAAGVERRRGRRARPSAKRRASCSRRPRLMCASRNAGSARDRVLVGLQRAVDVRRARARRRGRTTPARRSPPRRLRRARSRSARRRRDRRRTRAGTGRIPPASGCRLRARRRDRRRRRWQSPDSGIASGRWRRSSRIERVMRRCGHLRVGERLRGAQHDQVLEGEQPRAARAARGRDEPGGDQRADRAARQAQQALDVADAVGVLAPRCRTCRALSLGRLARGRRRGLEPAARAWPACGCGGRRGLRLGSLRRVRAPSSRGSRAALP